MPALYQIATMGFFNKLSADTYIYFSLFLSVNCMVLFFGEGKRRNEFAEWHAYVRRWQRGGHDPVSRTNFNKIHASRTVLTKFHES